MAHSVVMPELGESVTEGTITQWLKSVGDTVAVDEPLLEVSTDKVDTEIPSPVAGTILEIKAEEDETVDVGAVIAIIGDEGESTSDSSDDSAQAEEKSEPKAEEKAEEKEEKSAPAASGSATAKASRNSARSSALIAVISLSGAVATKLIRGSSKGIHTPGSHGAPDDPTASYFTTGGCALPGPPQPKSSKTCFAIFSAASRVNANPALKNTQESGCRSGSLSYG